MEILGVGVPEMAFIVLIALILLGPKDMIAAGRTMGRYLRKFLTSSTWIALRRTGNELQQLPTKLVREAGLEDIQREMQDVTNQIMPALDPKKYFDEAQIFDNSIGLVLPEESPKSGMPSSNHPTQNLSDPKPDTTDPVGS